MLDHIQLKNFKSACNVELPLRRLTLLAGLNGSGKSTVLQAIALLKQSLQGNVEVQELVLRGELISLGQSEDVRFENAPDDDISFVLRNGSDTLTVSAPAVPRMDTLPASCSGNVIGFVGLLENGFQFIQADRMTPALQYKEASTKQRAAGWLGCGGQFTVDYLRRNLDLKVSASRQFRGNERLLSEKLLQQVAPTESLIDQTAAWLQTLSPGVRPGAEVLELAEATSLTFSYTGTSFDSDSRKHRPSNVGFGLTYCLPIIVACLSARDGAILLLENPEAHLHPRGQFALGQLLAKTASDGVQILVETHSDHVLNGIRVAVKTGDLKGHEVAVHYFSRDVETGQSSVASPVVHDNGRLSEWPEGFFDEWSNALDELLAD